MEISNQKKKIYPVANYERRHMRGRLGSHMTSYIQDYWVFLFTLSGNGVAQRQRVSEYMLDRGQILK